MTFKTSISLPVCKKNAVLLSISNKTNEQIQKYLIEGDAANIEQCFNECIKEHTNIKYPARLSTVDKFIILSKLRCISFGSGIKLAVKESTISVNLEDTIKKLQSIEFKKVFVRVGKNRIYLSPPSEFAESNDNVCRTIQKIDNVYISDLTEGSKLQVFKAINGKIAEDITDYILHIKEKFKDIAFLPNLEQFEISQILLNPYDQSLFEIIKIIWRNDLFDLYRSKYVCLTKLHLAVSDYDSMIPAETRMFLNFYREEVDQQQEDLKKEQKQVNP